MLGTENNILLVFVLSVNKKNAIRIWMLKSHSEWQFLELQRKDDEYY